MTSITDDVVARASDLARDQTPPEDASTQLMAAAHGDRRTVESARDQVAGRLRKRVDDFEATATLQLLNRVLSHLPIHDPLDWKVRWGQRFRRP
ncbi:MAG: hypothetical protein M0Z30_11510 [Actinomycetota bacterium]|nr:hypothetical protein [Actinomycetota bacterium]